MIKRLLLMLVLCSISFSLNHGNLSAHGYIEETEPIDGAELDTAPSDITIIFSESLTPDSGKVTIVDGQGQAVIPERVYHAEDSDRILIAELPPELPEGAYIVTASAIVVSDGHEPTGSIVFWIGEKITATPDDETSSPAYMMLGVFLAGFGIASIIGFFTMQRAKLDVIPPSDEHSTYPIP